jgi:hypothetical protein
VSLDPSIAEGLAFIREEYAEVLRDNLRDPEEPDADATS